MHTQYSRAYSNVKCGKVTAENIMLDLLRVGSNGLIISKLYPYVSVSFFCFKMCPIVKQKLMTRQTDMGQSQCFSCIRELLKQ
jgi:hypothetical protein